MFPDMSVNPLTMEIPKSEAKAVPVRLRSHLNKYLVADADGLDVHQSSSAAGRRAIRAVEPSVASVRLRNLATGMYLAASDAPFLLGATGKRVVQADGGVDATWLEWRPVRCGLRIRLRAAAEGKFSRANGGVPPWRNSVTVDAPVSSATIGWTVWEVEAVEGWTASKAKDLAVVRSVPASPRLAEVKPAMEFFIGARAVRLRSHHGKYLTAAADEHDVTQERNGASRAARWAVEPVGSLIRLKSCYDKYLTADGKAFLLGMTGSKVLQTRRLDSAVEWRPVGDGARVKLCSCDGGFLRANGGAIPPWRNSVTHDIPLATSTQDWILWDVDVLEISRRSESEPHVAAVPLPSPGGSAAPADSFSSETSLGSSDDRVSAYSRRESTEMMVHLPPRSGGRMIHYHIVDEDGNVDDDKKQGYSLMFKGSSIEELKRKLEVDTGIQDIIVCGRSPLNGKLYPLRLQLPPNVTYMHVLVVPCSSSVKENFVVDQA